MEFVGIDIGTYKTTIASSKENGKILVDEQGKRSIKSILELTTPIRKFGNNITGEHEQSISLRHRPFTNNINENTFFNTIDDMKVDLMFFNYLNRIIKQNTTGNPFICLSVPSNYSNKDRRSIHQIAKLANLKIERIFNQISSIGMFAFLRRQLSDSKFVVIDFGHSKIECGYFKIENFTFIPINIANIKIGAQNFDEKLINIIFKKYKIDDTKLNREIIIRHLEKLKSILNNSKTAAIPIYINDTSITIQVTQEEFYIACSDELSEIKSFLSDFLNEIDYKGNDNIEFTGGNSSVKFINNIFENVYNVQSTLDLTESGAIGSSLGLACTIINNKYKINDIIGRDIFVRVCKENEETNNKSLVFKKFDFTDNTKFITYNKKTSFKVEFLENDTLIGLLNIEKEETENPQSIKIGVKINKFGFLEVISVKNNGEDVKFQYQEDIISEELINELVDTEDKYRTLENNVEKIGMLRNELETMTMGLVDTLDSTLKGLFTDEEINKARDIAMNLFDIEPSLELEQEEKLKEEIHKQLEFVSNKINDLQEKQIEKLNNLKNQASKFFEENPKEYTPSFYKLQGLFYKMENYLKIFKLDLYNIKEFDNRIVIEFEENFKNYIEKADLEIKEKKAAKLAEEKKKKEQAEKKKEVDLEKQNENKSKNEQQEEKQKQEDNKDDQDVGEPENKNDELSGNDDNEKKENVKNE